MIDSGFETMTGREGRGKPEELKVVAEEDLGVESSEAKKIKRVKVESKKGEEGWFIWKEYEEKDRVDEQLEKYQFLKERNYPVPEKAIVWPRNEKVILVTDLSEGGEKEVYSNNNWPEEIQTQLVNKDEIKEQLIKIADKAREDEVMITMDSYFLVVDKESSKGRVVIGDWGAAGVAEEKKREWGYDSKEAGAEAAEAFYQVVNKRFSKDKKGRVVLGGGYLWKK